MKILIISDRYPPYHEGGYGLKCKEVASTLQRLGHEIYVLTTKFGIDRKEIEGNIFRIFECCGKTSLTAIKEHYILTQLKRAFMFRRNFYITQRMLKDIKPDLVYIWQLYDASLLAVVAVQEMGIPCVFDVSDYWLLETKSYFNSSYSFLKKILRYVLTGIWDFSRVKTDNIIFTSEAVKRKYLAGGFKGSNFVVIHGGIEEVPYSEKRNINRIRDKKDVKLVCPARLVETKGVHVAVESVAYLRNSLKFENFTLDIIGTGPEDYIQKLRDTVKRERIEKEVQFIGQISFKELLERIKAYDILLFPSIWDEPLTRTIMHAMIEGIPVVATNTGGTPEIIEDNKTGLLVPPSDPIAMGKAVKKLIEDDYLYEEISKEGIKKVEKDFIAQKNVKEIDKYLRNVLTQIKK